MHYNEENPPTPIQYLQEANCVGTSKSPNESKTYSQELTGHP